ncbi:MAG TPA: MerR family transcriptional regulator, partial [Pseudodesulfovibrio sp.]|nr:MerR family transcriptional regulator [Pseudodesulfovibrio sp.]
ALRISTAMQETEALKAENRELKDKLAVMEAEMIRLRKDRREMEKYLLDKIKSVST